MEENLKLKQALAALKQGYETGDFSELVPYLSDNCEFDTMWRRSPVIGKEAVMLYFTEKGKSIAKSGTFPICRYVIQTDETEVKTHTLCGWDGKIVPIMRCQISHEKGKAALLMTQTLNDEKNTVYVDVSMDGDDKVRRILLLEKLFFQFEETDFSTEGEY